MPVTIDTALPLHDDRDTTWDGDAARSAMAAECGGRGENLDATCMGKGFLYRDGDADDNTIGAYKFPVASIFGGRKQIVWSGVVAAASRLESAKGIPDADLSRMRSALSTLYDRFADKFDDDSIRPPWESQTAAATSDDVKDAEDAAIEDDDEEYACSCCERAAAGGKTDPAQYDPVIRASAADGSSWAPPREWFNASDPAPLTVTPEGRIYGDLARFGQRHIGADGANIYPPKDPDGLYRAFRQRTIECADGDRIAVGVLTMDTGHAGMGIGAQAAVEHYDHTGAIVAAINIGEDREGPDGQGRIWLAGALLPDVTDEQRLRLMLSGVSGDWRQTRRRGPLELVAALAVNVPGFPVPAVEVADGRELAVVAAGAVLPVPPPVIQTVELDDASIDKIIARFQAAGFPASEPVASSATARIERARTASAVLARCVRRQRARRAQTAVVAAMRTNADRDDDSDRALFAQGGRFLDRLGRNWVEQTGGLPEGIRAVADELMAKGFGESHAIAIAVRVNKGWCWGAPDGLNWPGIQRVSPRTRARGCRNVLEWNLNRALARAT